jgi:type IV secretory pathway VirJ component
MVRVFVFVVLLCNVGIQSFGNTPDTLRYGDFGKVLIYRPVGTPKSFVIDVSGEDGWNKETAVIAQILAQQGCLVAGVDYLHYLKVIRNQTRKCTYQASDFETLSLFMQKKYKVKNYSKPILIGYSSGGAFVYAALAQAPGNTFKGAISLSFNPDVSLSKPPCNGTGLSTRYLKDEKKYFLEPSKKLTAPFIVLYGEKDKSVPVEKLKNYFHDFPKGELVLLSKQGHNFTKPKLWLNALLDAYQKILESPSFAEQKAIENSLLQSQKLVPLPGVFPITLIPSPKSDSLPLAFLISGDGGWTSFDQSLSETLADKGFSVVGLDAQKYFWDEKTPDETTKDISKAVEHFMNQWNKTTFILVGYSFGASVVPFVATRISKDLKNNLKGVYSLSPDEKADFEIHISDMLSIDNSDDNYNVLLEINKINTLKPVCIFGEEEEPGTRNNFIKIGVNVIVVPGSHHYNNDFSGVANLITKNLLKTN